MTPEERARLRELAAAATAGPWEDDFGEVRPPGYGFEIAVASRLSDAVYIAAVSPDVVLALLDAYDAGTEKILEAVQLAADTMDKLAVVRAERDRLAAAVNGYVRDVTTPVGELAAKLARVRALTYASDDGTEYEHSYHTATEGEPECPACWAGSILRALDGGER